MSKYTSLNDSRTSPESEELVQNGDLVIEGGTFGRGPWIVTTTHITTRSAATLRGLSIRRIQQHIKSGALPATHFGDRWMIDPADLDKIPTNKKPGPKPKPKTT